MQLLTTKGWSDYELLDSGNGKRFERFGKYTLVRPDPQCLWQPHLPLAAWEKADAVFREGKNGREAWVRQTELPHEWQMKYRDLTFYAKLSPFKHTGVFPEQHLMWDFITDAITKHRKLTTHDVHVLNLFGYTGIASLAAAQAGAKVTHVDASHPTIGWARENQQASGLVEKPIRWILDDCVKFVRREVKRGVLYDGIIMDPPVFGHGPKGERWEFFDNFPELLKLCQSILSKQPLFVIINAYAISASSIMLENVLSDAMNEHTGQITAGELVLEESSSGRLLSTGIFARWQGV